MHLTINLQALFILYQLHHAGYEGYIVGGAVRDLLLNNPKVMDYDFTTNATPENVQTVFPNHFYENVFGTVSVTAKHVNEMMGVEPTWAGIPVLTTSDSPRPQRVIDVAQATKLHESLTAQTPSMSDNPAATLPDATPNWPDYQITTYRSDGQYQDFRRPTSVTWGQTLQDDLDRRDFTINALALKVNVEFLNSVFPAGQASSPQPEMMITLPEGQFEIIDLHQGLADLETGVIRTVGTATTRFNEDALRMLRAIRFSVQLNLPIDPTTFAAIVQDAQLIQHVSGERIRDELFKILASDYPAEGIELLDESGLLTHILPEIQAGKGVQQSGHHTTDVWTHSLDALRWCPSTDPLVRLATLLHDVAKPQTQRQTGTSITFYNHEIIGAKMAKHIGYRLKLSKTQIDRVYILVRQHMFHYQPHNTDAAIRRFMRKVGLTNIDDILDLREADRLGSGARKTSWRLEEMKQRMIAQLHQPLAIKDLAINGHDIMTTCDLPPGPMLGEVLKYLFELVLDKPELNTRDSLLELAKTYLVEHR